MQKHQDLPKAFADLGVEVRFLKALQKMGFVEPTDIQRHLIPAVLAGRDLFGQARTGTGKTTAFGLPILQRLDPAGRLQALCMVPTRELVVQVAGELQRLAEFSGLHIVTVYGGQKMATQLHHLGRKPHCVVGTPGRVLDFLRRGAMDISQIPFAVLDEVDRMLDIGFRDDIRAILSRIQAKHQTVFVSATLSDDIKQLGMRYMTDPAEINVSQDKVTVDEVDQSYVTVNPQDKFQLLRLILQQAEFPFCIIFCNTKHGARKLAKKLFDLRVNVREIHGDLMQNKRERVMDLFRKRKIQVLVATDLASRGLDVSAISHIINYDMPRDPEIYVHRIGRTARMGARGTAISFVTREEGKELTSVERLINREIPRRIVDGFAPGEAFSAPPPREAEPPAMSRFRAPVFSDDANVAVKPPPKTLGSRFRPSRGRRRL